MSKKSLTLVALIAFICGLGLIGTATGSAGQKVIANNDRVIELADSPARIMLQGNGTYRVSLDGKNFSRELPRRNQIRLRHLVFDPLVNPPLQAAVTKAQPGVKLYIVQCLTQAIVPFQEKIAGAGGEICGTLPDNALIVAMSNANAARNSAPDSIRIGAKAAFTSGWLMRAAASAESRGEGCDGSGIFFA